MLLIVNGVVAQSHYLVEYDKIGNKTSYSKYHFENGKKSIEVIENIEIEQGDIILFPSSIFHKTIPFVLDENRITLAFDIKPIY